MDPRFRDAGSNWLVARRHRLGTWATALILLAPALALLGWLMVYASAEVVHLAFTRWDGFSAPESVGLQNFSDLVHDHRFKEAVLNNLAFVAAIPVWIAVPYGIAWALHSKIWGWRLFRLAFFLPVVLSPVVVGVYYGLVLKPMARSTGCSERLDSGDWRVNG